MKTKIYVATRTVFGILRQSTGVIRYVRTQFVGVLTLASSACKVSPPSGQFCVVHHQTAAPPLQSPGRGHRPVVELHRNWLALMETSVGDIRILAESRHCPVRPAASTECQAHAKEMKRVSSCDSIQNKKLKKDGNNVVGKDTGPKPVLTAQDVSIMVSQDEATLRKLIHEEIVSLTKERGMEKSICPSEVARKLFPNGWRSVMQLVRDVGSDLALEGRIVILQKGQAINPENVRGPIRFRYVQ